MERLTGGNRQARQADPHGGVGILGSAPTKDFGQKLKKSGVLPAGRPSLLQDAFDGRIGSATGKPGRGLGLPRMKKDAERERLLELTVLTSDVVGSIGTSDFRSAGHSLTRRRFPVGDPAQAACGESHVLHRERRGACVTRRWGMAHYWAYSTDDQRRQAGCIAARMQRRGTLPRLQGGDK